MTPGVFPETFGRFVLTSLLATGGMCEVLLGKEDGVYGARRRVVVKRLLPALSGDPRFVALFQEEARIAVLLQHPNVAQVWGHGQVEDRLYLAMEYVDGVDLGVCLARLRHDGVRMPVDLALHLVAEVARGLDCAHGQRQGAVVHRDVSPSNILLSRDGVVKICDFGIASVVHSAPAVAESVRGKFSYMSPEQASGRPVDPRSDLFSLGLVLWELLQGERHHRAATEAASLALARRGEPRPLALPGEPRADALGAILTALLAHDPALRTPHARALRRSLEGVRGDRSPSELQEALTAFLERTCATELRRRGQRRDALPVTGEPTPVTAMVEPEPAVRRPSRAFIPTGARETVSVPDLFPVVVSEAPKEQEVVFARPERREAPAVVAGSVDDRLVQHLEKRGLLLPEILERVRARARGEQVRFLQALVDLHEVDESALCHALSELHDLPAVDLSSWALPTELVALLPLRLAQAGSLVPFHQERGSRPALCVAMWDPDGRLSLPEVERHCGMPTKAFLAPAEAVAAAIDRLYRGLPRSIPPLRPR